MATTYTQLHVHVIFAVQNRACIIRQEWQEQLHRYITGIVQKLGHKLLAINSMPDHVHILLGHRPNQSLSDLMQAIKGTSSKWINDNGFAGDGFSWQQGYGAFSVSKMEVASVIQYIRDQEAHHRRRSFLDEYKAFLDEYGVEYDVRFLFQPISYDR